MATIRRLEIISGIRAGPGSKILPDHTIQDPEPYEAVSITLDDDVVIQVERPLTKVKVKAAYDAAVDKPTTTIDGISTGDSI